MGDCVDCTTAAKVWHWGGYASSCSRCAVRALAKSPKAIRLQGYERLAADNNSRRLLMARVKDEVLRIDALRVASGGKPRC